jgi:hypothetical protein
MKAGRFLASGILGGIVILIVSMIVSFAVQAAFGFNMLMLSGMRSISDPIMALFFLHPFVLSFAMTYAYGYIKGSLKGNYMKKGEKFGLIMWIVISIPSAFLVFSSMDYPVGFTVNSIVGPLIYMLAAGIVIAKLIE